MTEYITKDSGKRVDFSTGSRRDTNEGKWRIDLIWVGFLVRLGELLARGAKKYDVNNWMLGQPIDRSYESALRHLMQWKSGDTSEDHLAAVCFNIMSIMYVVTKVKLGELPMSLMKALDKDGNPSDRYFECADMPTLALQSEAKSTEKQKKERTALIRMLIGLCHEDLKYVGQLADYASISRIDAYGILKGLIDKKVLLFNPEKREYRFADDSGYVQCAIEVLLSLQGKPLTYKEFRDRTESRLHAYGRLQSVNGFNGGTFLATVQDLNTAGIVLNDGDKDGNYYL